MSPHVNFGLDIGGYAAFGAQVLRCIKVRPGFCIPVAATLKPSCMGDPPRAAANIGGRPEFDRSEGSLIMRPTLGGPRLLLRRLRELMAESIGAQARLDRTVSLIASNVVAEVCSIYVARDDGVMELFASQGLAPKAVHVTTMKPGEGLVGLVVAEAKPVNLSNARAHPAFSYKPETGEEEYQSFLGVPILRLGNVLGVLVVQNRTSRLYTEDEVEALQTTAMVLAETIASAELQTAASPGTATAARRSMRLQGSSLSEGVGLGHAVLHDPRIVVRNLVADDPQTELTRLQAAVEGVRASIDDLIARGDVIHHGEHREVLETVRMFANDQGWQRRIREAITSGLTAEAAVERVQSDTRARMMRQTDPYLRERLHDLEDLANRVLGALVDGSSTARRRNLPENAIVVARNMGPAALLDYDRSRLRGLVLEEAGPSSHVAIVARALGIPAVGEVEGIVSVVDGGDAIVVDGAGDVHVRPQPNVEAAYSEKAKLRARRQEQYRKLKHTPSVTKDGVEIALALNAGLSVDLPHIDETGARGIGLFRTELQFMIAERLPTTAKQRRLYGAVMDAAGDRPVVFRTLDIGGDKLLPYQRAVEEENPALGWRAIRIGLDRPGLLRSQVRALLQAAAGREMSIMFPMVATVEEFERARDIVEREKNYLASHGHELPAHCLLGTMIEAPSLLFQLEELLTRVDFVSVGSNDLLQFLFAADRDNPRVSERFDPLSPPALRALMRIVDHASAAGVPATICGEIAGRPLEAMALIALGYRSLSMSPASIGPVKAMLLSLDVGAARRAILPMVQEMGCNRTLRSEIAALAKSYGVAIEQR
jgi:phosphotransferase system, enzyme I, PtsP